MPPLNRKPVQPASTTDRPRPHAPDYYPLYDLEKSVNGLADAAGESASQQSNLNENVKGLTEAIEAQTEMLEKVKDTVGTLVNAVDALTEQLKAVEWTS